jgi:hypothetical protein
LQDQLVICGLVRGEGGDPFFGGFPRLTLLFQFQFSGSFGVLEFLRVPDLGLHELVLQLSGDFPLSIQSFLVLLGELLFFSCNPEAKC